MPARVRDQRGLETTADGDAVDRLTGVTGLHRLLRLMRPLPKPSTVCPACGATLEKVLATGLMGCGLCYSVFADKLKLTGGSSDLVS
ncbi:MAG: hypothetical protein KF857_12985 [Fimbriimonadaceae bacterium]|nr:hypothetical protein [Fimbriimonadaceae bacterium]